MRDPVRGRWVVRCIDLKGKVIDERQFRTKRYARRQYHGDLAAANGAGMGAYFRQLIEKHGPLFNVTIERTRR